MTSPTFTEGKHCVETKDSSLISEVPEAHFYTTWQQHDIKQKRKSTAFASLIAELPTFPPSAVERMGALTNSAGRKPLTDFTHTDCCVDRQFSIKARFNSKWTTVSNGRFRWVLRFTSLIKTRTRIIPVGGGVTCVLIVWGHSSGQTFLFLFSHGRNFNRSEKRMTTQNCKSICETGLNSFNLTFIYTMFKIQFPPHRKYTTFPLRRRTLFRKITAVCCERHTKYRYILWAKISKLVNVKVGGIHSYHSALKK